MIALTGGSILTGCFGNLATRLADREAYGIIEQKQAEALGHSDDFSIDAVPDSDLRGLSRDMEFFADEMTSGPVVISLSDALALSLKANREYRTRKELLYLSALDLTGERHEFSPIFSGQVTARAVRDDVGSGAIERFGEVLGDLAVTQIFATGARVTVGYATDMLHIWSSDPEVKAASGALSVSLVQPLLRNVGTLVTLENLRQAERDVIYEVRNFARFRQDFVIDRIGDYYRVLQALDAVDNEWRSYQRLRIGRERAEAMMEAERTANFQVDQARQDEIRARNRWIRAKTSYETSLDRFRIDLGMPTELHITADPHELEVLRERGPVKLGLSLQLAEQAALDGRLDFLTVKQLREDSHRRLEIAENSLLPVLDARVEYQLESGEDVNKPLKPEGSRRDYAGELSLELPLDRKGERNHYRRSQIRLERRKRDVEALRNEILAGVRRTYREVSESRESYEIQLKSRELADDRVNSVNMLLQAGREGVNIRDRLEAEDALLEAENNVTRELVNYTIARLEFYHAIEQLEVDEQGNWHEELPTSTTASLR